MSGGGNSWIARKSVDWAVRFSDEKLRTVERFIAKAENLDDDCSYKNSLLFHLRQKKRLYGYSSSD
jgi:hypothetical protein